MDIKSEWSPRSWRHLSAQHQPPYPDEARLEASLDVLRKMLPLVSKEQVDDLRNHVAKVSS